MASWLERFKSAASVFRDPSRAQQAESSYGEPIYISSRARNSFMQSKDSVVDKIYNQISVDVASTSFRHVKTDQNGRYKDDVDSYLNRCITFRPNIDQTCRAFFQDLVWTTIERGVAAVVPVDTTKSIFNGEEFDVRSMRVGKITKWFPQHVTVEVYNDRTGRKQEITVPKVNTAIVNNPLADVMNSSGSDLNRLLEKLALLDKLDQATAAGKLDLIIQLPYEVRSDLKRSQAKKRRGDIEAQLAGSQLGIAYLGATERVTQLNRPVTNNLLEQIEYLTKQVYNSLGLTEGVFNGTADAQTMTNYYIRTINPILDEIVLAFSWAFLSQTARTQKQTIRWFRSAFALVPMEKFPEIAVQLSSGEIASANELREVFGWKMSVEETAEQLRNPNINPMGTQPGDSPAEGEGDIPEEGDTRPLADVPLSELM